MARVSKMASGKVSLARGIQRRPNLFLFLSLDVHLYIVKCMYVCIHVYILYIFIHTHISACAEIYIIYRRNQTILRVEHIYTNRELCEVLA